MDNKFKTLGDLCEEACYEEVKKSAMGLAAGLVGLGFDVASIVIDKIDNIDILGDIRTTITKLNNSLGKTDYTKDNGPLTIKPKK